MGDKGQDSRNALSKSRSKSKREFVSRNPFVNFLQNFRRLPENHSTPPSAIFKIAGERWRSMNEMEKAPYISAANEIKSKEPRIKNPKGKKKGEGKNPTTKVTTDKNKKKIKKRKCSKCGHRHGSPSSRGGSTDSFDKEALDDDDEDDDKTTVRSRSRSASRSGSRSGSGSTNGESNYWSDSDTTA